MADKAIPVLPPFEEGADAYPAVQSPTVEQPPVGAEFVDSYIINKALSGGVSLPGILTGVLCWFIIRHVRRFLRQR